MGEKHMKTIEKATMMTLMVVAGLPMGGRAQDRVEPVAGKPAQEIEAKIDEMDAKIADLQRKKEAMEQQKAETERLAEQQEELANLRNESRDRIKDADEQLVEMPKEELLTAPAQLSLVEAKRKFLDSRKALDMKLLAIEGATALDLVKLAREEINQLETEWSMVLEPNLTSAVAIEELEESLAQENNPQRRDILANLKLLAAKDAESRKQELALLKARQEREKAWAKLFKDFEEAH
jgi:hypothetical protein